MNAPGGPQRTDDELREHGLQIATRLVAVLRTGRSYTIGNQVFSRQLDQLLDVLRPVLLERERAQIVSLDGDLHLNGVRLPIRSASLKFTEQLGQEFALRGIAGVEFVSGLDRTGLESFMRFFLPSELYKGDELVRACATEGVRFVTPVTWADPAEAAGEPDTEACPGWSGALHAYDRALHNAHLLLGGDAMQRGIELRHLKRIAQPLVDSALAGEAPPAALALMLHAREYGWTHAVHVCLVAVSIGRVLGLTRGELAELGVAALLHDAGKDAVALGLLEPAERWSAEDRARAERHTVEGLKRLARSTTLNPTTLIAMRAALEHHATDGGGYPALGLEWPPSVISRIVGIADAFVSFLSHRSPRGAHLTPYDALGLVLGPLGERFHPALRAALVRAVGLYPPGQIVELDDGSLARALGVEPAHPERPLVEIVAGPGGVPAPVPRSFAPLAPGRHVVRALPLEQWPGPTGARAA